MKIRITLPLRSNHIINHQTVLRQKDRAFHLLVNPKGILSAIAIEIQSTSEADYPTLHGDGRTYGVDLSSPAFSSALDIARTAEGLLCNYGVQEFNFQNILCEWLAENEQEQRSIKIPYLRIAMAPPEPVRTSDEVLSLLFQGLLCADRAQETQIPLTFLRKGNIEFNRQRYIDAFYEHFFMIESEFGNGKFKERDLISEFSNSTTLIHLTEKTQSLHPDIIFEAEEAQLIKEKYQKRSFAECWQELIRTRGRLHHHSKEHPQKWNPHIHTPFKVDSAFLYYICIQLGSQLYCKYALEESNLKALREANIQQLIRQPPKPSSPK